MAAKTKIEWTDATWNPVSGCSVVSPGCDHCYAETFAERWRGTPGHYFEHGFDVQLRPDKLDLPLRWVKPRRIFVNSMSDLFHDEVPVDYIGKVFAVMMLSPRHTFQVLTKRHGRMRSLLNDPAFRSRVAYESGALAFDTNGLRPNIELGQVDTWPLRNVWLGVSAEDQRWADIRIPALLETPAAVRFVSAEPLLGPIDFHGPLVDGHRPRLTYWLTGRPCFDANGYPFTGAKLDWVIVGGESGHGARPMHPDWVRTIRDQCQQTGTAFLFKQWGEWQDGSAGPDQRGPNHIIVPDGRHEPAVEHQNEPRTELASDRIHHRVGMGRSVFISRVGKKSAGRELDGRTWDEFPS